MPSVARRARISRPLCQQILFASILCSSCASSSRQALEPTDVAAALTARSPELAGEVADPTGLAPLAFERPSELDLADPTRAGFWRACAIAWNPKVRAARRELAAALALAGGAGRPGPWNAMVENQDFEDIGQETKLWLTFDLLGLAGLGPTRAARASARAEATRARSVLEAALWTALFEVDRARLRVSASRQREARLSELLAQVAVQSERFEILSRRGRLSEARMQMASVAWHEVEHGLSLERARRAQLVAELAVSSGLPSGHPAFEAVQAAGLAIQLPATAPVDALALLAQHPRLRELRSDYALAEAQVREVAAEAWPMLQAGPQFHFQPSDVLVGGILDVALPWPGTVGPRVRAAEERREAARERLEDELLLLLAQSARLEVELSEARLRAEEHATPIDAAAESAWLAAEVRLRWGRAEVEDWGGALRERLTASLALIDERERVLLLELDLREARGVVAPAPPEVLP